MLEKFVEKKEQIVKEIEKILSFELDFLEENNKENLKLRMQSLKEHIKKEKVTIGVMATVSNGKSTFLNALIFEEPILQAKSGETTATLFEIRYGKNYKVNDKVLNSLDEVKKEIESVNQKIFEKKDEFVKIIEKGLIEKIEKMVEDIKVVIELPFEKLKNIILLDTPGYGSLNEFMMMEILKKASKQSDAIVLILDISQGLKKEDKLFLEQIKENNLVHKTFIVLNKIDAVISEDDLVFKSKEELEKEIKNVINDTKENINKILKTDYIFVLSAKKALVAKFKKDESILKESRFSEFENLFWDEVVKLKNEKFQKEVNSWNNYKKEFCEIVNFKLKDKEVEYSNTKEFLDVVLTHEIGGEIEVLKKKKEKLQNINLSVKVNYKEFKEKVIKRLESDLEYRLEKVGLFDSFSEDEWNYAVKRGIEDFEKDFGEMFINDYFTPLLIEIQKKINEANEIIKEINLSIQELSKLTNKKLKTFEEIPEDFEVSPDGKLSYTSKEFVSFLEDLGFGITGIGVGAIIELGLGRLISFAIPGVGWILGIASIGYTIYKQNQKYKEVLELVLNELKPQVLEILTQKQLEIQNRILYKTNNIIKMRIGEISNVIDEMEVALNKEKEENQTKLQNFQNQILKLQQISKEVCN